jgi:hypothetical protein
MIIEVQSGRHNDQLVIIFVAFEITFVQFVIISILYKSV